MYRQDLSGRMFPWFLPRNGQVLDGWRPFGTDDEVSAAHTYLSI